MGWVDNFRLMWLENSVKYLKPFSPQPTQFPEKPANIKTKKNELFPFFSFKYYSQSSRVYEQLKTEHIILPGSFKMVLIAVSLLHSYLRLWTDWPKSAFFPFSSGKKRRSTAHTRMCSGMLGDLAPTSSKPAGTSMDSVAMETSRRSLPAWQNPEERRGRQGCDILWVRYSLYIIYLFNSNSLIFVFHFK